MLAAWGLSRTASKACARSQRSGFCGPTAGAADGRARARPRRLFGRAFRARGAPRSLGQSAVAPPWLDPDAPRPRVRVEDRSPEAGGPGRRLVEALVGGDRRRKQSLLATATARDALVGRKRVPFLTVPLAEFLLSLPEHYLLSDRGETKHIFRAAMRGIVPDPILDRKDKIGFATPEQAWLSKIGPTVRGWIADAPRLPFVRQDWLQARFDAELSGERPLDTTLWRFINFYRWFQIRNVAVSRRIRSKGGDAVIDLKGRRPAIRHEIDRRIAAVLATAVYWAGGRSSRAARRLCRDPHASRGERHRSPAVA